MQYINWLKTFIDRVWYAPLLGLIAIADIFLIFLPSDGLLLSSSILVQRRWLSYALFTAVGSTIGAIILAALVELQGLPYILSLYPGIEENNWWAATKEFIDDYGLFVVFAVAATPLMQQPTIILASLANTPLIYIGFAFLFGRIIKCLIIAYIGAYAPHLIKRLKMPS